MGAWPAMFAAGCSCDNKVSDGTGDGGSTQTDGSVVTCTTPEECASGKTCSNGICVPDSCPGSDTPGCNCEAGCNGSVIGPGGTAFNPTPDNSSEVELDPNGFLVIKTRELPKLEYIWVANTGPGFVSKVSTSTADLNPNGTFKEVARYRTGPSTNTSSWWSRPGGSTEANDPSRTTINVVGDAFVGNRRGKSVTKIAGVRNASRCPDRNNNGIVDSSSGTVLMDWGSDECVLWTTPLPGADLVRAMASQDLPLPDGGWAHYVWVGSWNNHIYKLDGETGAILLTLKDAEVPTHPYGFALDKNENLWIASYDDGAGIANCAIGRIDTKKCSEMESQTPGSCKAAPVCAETDDFSNCVKQKIFTMVLNGNGDRARTYGVTVDKNQHVWFGMQSGIVRYDPSQPAESRWARAVTGATFGISADGLGFVYAAANTTGIYVTDANGFANASAAKVIPGTESGRYRGMAVDADGRVWGISVGPSPDDGVANEFATVIEPQTSLPRPNLATATGPELSAYFKIHTVTPQTNQSAVGFDFPYTYSDMTGLQYRLATGKLGSYATEFAGCPADAGVTTWQNLFFDVATPPGTYVQFSARAWNSGEERPDYVSVGYVFSGERPPGITQDSIGSPAALANALGTMVNKQTLEIKVDLAVYDTEASVLTPTIKSFEATHACVRLTE